MLELVDKSDMRICHKCGNETYLNKYGHSSWYKYYDKDGNWDGMLYLCHKCHLDSWARTKGFKDFAEYSRIRSWNKGISHPMSENKDCTLYLGIHIAERLLSKIFKDIKRMNCNNRGYDFICKMGFKIDVKSSVLNKKNNCWQFGISYNHIADYFLLLAFDNRECLNPLHIWLFKRDDMIRGKEFFNRKSITFPNDDFVLYLLDTWELTDKLEELKDCCNELRSK